MAAEIHPIPYARAGPSELAQNELAYSFSVSVLIIKIRSS